MSGPGFTILRAVVAALAVAAIPASAQTAVNLSLVSGNGQLICPSCQYSNFKAFEPLVVQVTDASGNPVPSAGVNWSVTAGNSASVVLASAHTTTTAGGTSTNTVTLAVPGGRIAHQVVASLATNSNVSVTFYLTQGAPESSTQYAYGLVSGLYTTYTGSVGTTALSALQVTVQDFLSQPVPNVAIRLIPAPGYTPGASVSCATGNGADPGSVLTDSTGTAVCAPVFGPLPSPTGTTGTYHVLEGAGNTISINGSQPAGYQEFGSLFIQVTPGTPGVVRLISGNQQNGTAGQNLASPLVAEVDTASGIALAGQAVTWTVTPAGAAILSQASSATDLSGRASTLVALAPTAAGSVLVQVKASNGIAANFTVNAVAPLTGLSKASGDAQVALINEAFAQPLVVQVAAATGQPLSGIPVHFSISGPGTLNNATVATDSTGSAAVAVTAGSTTGVITVTATAGIYSVTFTLNVAASGPVLTQSSFLNGAGFYATDQTHSALAPCAIGTIIAPGIAPTVQGVVTGSMFGPLPYQLAQVTISFNSSQAPLYNVANVGGQQQVAFQVPCDVVPSASVPATVTVSGLATVVNVVVRSAGPGVFEYAMSDGVRRAVLVRSDGSFVSLENPAHRGDVLRMFATGIGQVQPSLATNSVPEPGIDSVALGQVSISLNGSAISATARRMPDAIGLDEVTFQVPSTAPTGSNIPLLLSVAAIDNAQNPQLSNLSKIPIQ